MAHTKSAGTTKNQRDSQPKYLGVKLYAGQSAKTGNIIVRQRGSKFKPGVGVRLGNDYTIYAVKDGVVKFQTKRIRIFNGSQRTVKIVHVV